MYQMCQIDFELSVCYKMPAKRAKNNIELGSS
jgi:hypothetical protein